DDATWLLTSAFIIFTMQSGFGLLESGCVSSKNEVNIMAKNVADVVFGGMSYWMLGYGLSYGDSSGTNGFCGIGKFFIDPGDATMGVEFSRFFFQSSFATTATTIVSGSIAERTRYVAYIVFSFFNTFVFCIPAHWVWSENGWLNRMGVVDVAGDGPVHLVGGAVSLVAAIMIKPRAKRFTSEDDHEMGSPSGSLLGLFVLWWGWLAFNCGSTYGISGGKWKLASRAAATTLMAGISGGIIGTLGSFLINKKKFLIPWIINGTLGGLVSITASCAVTGVWESLVIGSIGAVLVLLTDVLLVKLHIDDPVSAIAVHFTGGVWGLLATGLFVHKDTITFNFAERPGVVQGGGFHMLGIQALAVVSITVWSVLMGGAILKAIDVTVGLRLSAEDEELGADMAEHNIR
ncbi:unnamed protein product, partial [Lymnaea stagnalis]